MTFDDTKFNEVLRLVPQWRHDVCAISLINSESIQSLEISPNDEFVFIPPQLTKDIYYSPFVHVLIEHGHRTSGSIYAALELAYTMVFTPSQSGWCQGQVLAEASAEDTNYVVRFINNMVNIESFLPIDILTLEPDQN